MSSVNTMQMSQAMLAQEVSMAVAEKSLGHAKAQGEAVVQLLESAMEVQRETTEGSRPASPDGIGRRLDVVA